MLKKILFSLMIGLFTVIALGSGATVMCNEISLSLNSSGYSKEETDGNLNPKDENNNNLSTDDEIKSNVNAVYKNQMVVRSYAVTSNIKQINGDDYNMNSSGDGYTEGTMNCLRSFNGVVTLLYNGIGYNNNYTSSTTGNYTFTVASLPSGYNFLGWFYFYEEGTEDSRGGPSGTTIWTTWTLQYLTSSRTWSGSNFGYYYSNYNDSNVLEWTCEYLVPLIAPDGVVITDLQSYDVVYHYRNSAGTDTTYNQNCTVGTSYKYYNPTNIYSNYNWSFRGWDRNGSAASSVLSAGASFSNLTTTNGGVVNLYAQYNRTITVTYNGNGSTSGSVSSSSYTQYANYRFSSLGCYSYSSANGYQNVSVSAKSNGYSRTGYTFANWGTSSSGGTLFDIYDNIYTLFNGCYTNARQTLYAQWAGNVYRLTVNAFGGSIPNTAGWEGSGNTATKQVVYASNYGNLPTPERAGYQFDGWWTNTSSGTQIKENTVYNVVGDYTIYARWSVAERKVTIHPYVSNTNGLSYVSGVPESYTLTANGGTGNSVSVSVTSGSPVVLKTSFLTGYNISINHNCNPNEWQLMGIYTYETTPTMIQKNPIVTVSDSEDTDLYVYFARSSANKLQYDKNLNYFYFEDGYFPQSGVKGGPTSGSASGRTYNIAGISYASYIVGEQEYVNVNNTIFKVEPIIWRVSDYGVSETDYPSVFDKFGAFSNNITAVSDKVLNVGSALTREQFKNTTWNNWSLTSSNLPNYVSEVTVNYAKSIGQTYDKFGGVGNVNVVSGTATGLNSNVRVASKADLTNAGLTDYDGRASDLVKYLLGCGTYANYWTTNLGSQYGAGQVITTGNLTKDIWLYEKAGLRFAMTFNESVRQSGDSNTYRVVVKELYDSATVKVYNSDKTSLKATYTNIVNNQIALNVGYDDVIEITNLTRNNNIHKGFRISNNSEIVTINQFKQLNNNNGLVEIKVEWALENLASNFYDKLSFSYNHNTLTAGVLAANANISGEVVIPEFVTHPTNGKIYKINKVKGYGFQNCKNITSVIMSDSITGIGINAFNGCTGLREIKLSKNLTDISNNAFYNCSSLTSITLPDSLREVGNGAFYGCTNISRTNFEGTLAQWATINFYENGNPITYSKNLYINNTRVRQIDLADSNITYIGSYAFYNLKDAISLILPNTVKEINSRAFYGCENMIGNFATSIEKVYDYGFYGCKKLTGTVGALSVVGGRAFSGCRGLTSVTISSSVNTISAYAFNGCQGLQRTNFTGTLAQWATINFISQSSNPISYSHNLYINGSQVTNINLANSNITFINSHAFYNLTTATSLTLPSTLKTIYDAAFKNCSGIKGTLTIPNSVTYIGESAFYHCSELTSVIIGDGVTTICERAFERCYKLSGIKIGNSVSTINRLAFVSCQNLKNIYIPYSVTTITGAIFSNCPSDLTIYCNRSSRPSGWNQNWNLQGSTTSGNVYFSTVWSRTYAQYQNATGGAI